MTFLMEDNDRKPRRGNVCVSETGQLFVVLNLYHKPSEPYDNAKWFGIGFNGLQVVAERCKVVYNNLNEYMSETYSGQSPHMGTVV